MTLQEEHSQMVKQLAKSGESIISSLTPVQMHRLHMAIGVAGEVGEIIEVLQDISDEKLSESEALENLVEEFGDAFFYLRGYIESLPTSVELKQYPRFVKLDEKVVLLLIISSSKLLDAAKRDGIYQKANVEEQAILAIQDLYKNLHYLMDNFEITEEMALEHNLNKLLKGKNARYASGSYSDQQANERADKQ